MHKCIYRQLYSYCHNIQVYIMIIGEDITEKQHKKGHIFLQF